jgi:hypothetical protein
VRHGKAWRKCGVLKNPKSACILLTRAKLWSSCGTIMKLGGKSFGLNPLVSLKLWKSITLPSMLYGCELWRISKKEIKRLEKAQNMLVRIMQGLLPGCSG